MSADSFTVRITARNQDPDNLSTFVIKRNPSFEFYNEEVSLTKAYIPYTWHSVTAEMGNNQFSYQMNGQIYPVQLTNGNHSIESINDYLPSQLNLQIDPQSRLVRITATDNAQLIVPATKFADLIGFLPGSYGASQGVALPRLNTIGVCNINTNIVNTTMTAGYVSWNCLDTFLPTDDWGSVIVVEPATPNWMRIIDGSFDSISISLTDHENQPLRLLDPRVYVELEFRKRVSDH